MKPDVKNAGKKKPAEPLADAGGKIRTLEARIASLETDLFETREIISGVKALNRVPGLEDKVKVFNSILREYLDSECSVFFLYWPGDETFRLAESTGMPESLLPEHAFKRFEGLFWELICQSEIFTTRAANSSDRFTKLFRKMGLDGTDLEFFVPLAMAGEPVGLAGFKPRETLELLNDQYPQHFADQATPTIKTAMLYEINQRDKQQLDQTLTNLKLLYNIGRMMVHISDLKELLKFILDEACKTTEAAKGSLMLYDEYTHVLVVRVVRGLPDAEVEKKINDGEIACNTFRSGEGIAGRVFSEKKPIIVDNVAKDESFASKEQANVQSILCVPLIANDEAIGVINITNKAGGKRFTPEDQNLIVALAGQAAISIHRSQLYNIAIKDELTGLNIRRFFSHRIGEEIKRVDRYGGEFGLVMADIDHFKSVNDTFGHQVGDAALVALAKTIEGTLRGTDVPSRYGGEEFAILLPETSGEGALIMAERLRKIVSEKVIPEMGRAMTISLGVAIYPIHGRDLAGLIKSADVALYRAKDEGRNRVVMQDLPPKPAGEKKAAVKANDKRRGPKKS